MSWSLRSSDGPLISRAPLKRLLMFLVFTAQCSPIDSANDGSKPENLAMFRTKYPQKTLWAESRFSGRHGKPPKTCSLHS
ncbi:hypothetical protein BDW62DRAFT_177533 [Aspergillus aurantiobrunneus]